MHVERKHNIVYCRRSFVSFLFCLVLVRIEFFFTYSPLDDTILLLLYVVAKWCYVLFISLFVSS